MTATTSDRAVSLRCLPSSAGQGLASESGSAPGGGYGSHPVAGPELTRTAVHESSHACAAIILLGEDTVDVVSIRPGQGHRGITLLGDRTVDSREIREKEIVVTLVGDIAAWMVEPRSGYYEETPDETAALAAAAALDRLSPLSRDRLLGAEAAERDPEAGDEAKAWRRAWMLDGFDDHEAAAHLIYLRAVADGLVRRHTNAIGAVARALLAETTLDGPTVADIVYGSRCVCHAYWTTTEGSAAMRSRNKTTPEPKPAIPRTSNGVPIIVGRSGPSVTSVLDPHAMVASQWFFGAWGRVEAGTLADDRSPLVRRHPDGFRRPTAEEIAAAESPA